MKTNFKKDFDEYLELNPDFYRYYTESSYFELVDWYTEKYSKEMFVDRSPSEAYEFAKWVVDGMESTNPNRSGTKDHVVSIRERYKDVDFDRMTELDELTNTLLLAARIDPTLFGYEEESCMNTIPQVDYGKLCVGDLLWYRDVDDDITKWYEVVVTHIYGGVVFLKKTSGDDQDEFWLSKDSFGFYKGLYPKKVIIPKGTKCTCKCPLTVFENEP